jgi:hypothetical protein
MEAPFNVSQFKIFPHLTFSFSDPKSTISALNFLHLRFNPVQCSDPLVPKETLKGVSQWSSHLMTFKYNLVMDILLLLQFKSNITSSKSKGRWWKFPVTNPSRTKPDFIWDSRGSVALWRACHFWGSIFLQNAALSLDYMVLNLEDCTLNTCSWLCFVPRLACMLYVLWKFEFLYQFKECKLKR